MIYGETGGSTTRYVQLRYNNNTKLQTSNTGVSITGDLTASGNVISNSDITLKKNIETIPNALDKVLDIRGVNYNRVDIEGEPRHSGVIAQEVEKVLPEVVSIGENGTKTVAYGNMIGLLIEAIKEQQIQINNLKEEINSIKKNS